MEGTMTKKTLFVAILLAAFTTVSLAQAKPAAAPAAKSDDGTKVIKDTEAAWVKAFASKDATKPTDFYTDDAVLMANGPTVSGKPAILAVWKGMLADPNFSLTFSSTKVEMAKSGELAYSFGTYTLTLSDAKKKKMTDKGKYLTVWKKQADGSWKAVADVANSDPPTIMPTK
jgi:uncharacterized protein (TIGR02246 family)